MIARSLKNRRNCLPTVPARGGLLLLVLLFTSGVSILLAPQNATATPITIYFQGDLQSISGGLYPLSLPLLPGHPVSGFVEFETEGAIDINTNPDYAQYFNLVTQLSVSINGFVYESTGSAGSEILVDNEANLEGYEAFVARTNVTGPSISGFTPDTAQFGLSNRLTNLILTSDELPTVAQLQSMFVSPENVLNSMRLVGTGGNLQFLSWWVRDIRIVPEPGTALLLMIGLACLSGTRPQSSH